MDITPIQSAEEAALAAVNLGPALSPSSPIPATTESLTHTHGLLILERDATGEPTWFACKFCPIFGTEKSREGYLRLYRAPFKPSQMEAHLKRDHPEHWQQYRVLDLQQKRQFFHGKRLPPPAVFQQRMKELEKAWAPIRRKRKKTLPVDATSDTLNVPPMKRHKLLIVNNYSKQLPTDDDWIGRKAFRPAEPPAKNVLFESRKCDRPLPGQNFGKLLSTVLEQYSEPFPEDIQSLVNPSEKHADEHDTAITPPWSADGTVTLAGRAFFYLLRGLPADLTATLLQESAQLGWPLRQPSEPDANMLDIAEGSDMKQLTAISESLPDVKPAIEPDSLVPFVSNTAHFIEMAALLALKRIIEERHTWTIALATRPCPMRNGALEIMIPVLAPSLESSCETKAGEELSLANTVSQQTKTDEDNLPPGVTHINGGAIHDHHEQKIVEASAARLLSLAVTAFLLGEARESLSEARGNLSEKAATKRRRGIRERVKLVLMDSLEFFCEVTGPTRASDFLKESLNVRKLVTDWLFSALSDNEAIRGVYSNYHAVDLHLSDVERQTEKKVLSGLRLCVRTAKDSFRGNFHSPIIYAREVLNKAIDDFDTIMPALGQIPTEQDPLHLISVRDSTDAVETVTRLLDFVCPHWSSKLIGVNSSISSDSPLKPLEQKLVETLKLRKGSDFVVVDKPDDKPHILPSAVMNMTPLQFEELILSYIKDNSSLQSNFVDLLRKQREILINRRQGNTKDSWTSYEDLQALVTFIRAIELLWSRSHCKIGAPSRFSGIVSREAEDEAKDGASSDRDIERILRARTLIDVEQRRLLHKLDPGTLRSDTSQRKECSIPWGGNWSNAMPCASD